MATVVSTGKRSVPRSQVTNTTKHRPCAVTSLRVLVSLGPLTPPRPLSTNMPPRPRGDFSSSCTWFTATHSAASGVTFDLQGLYWRCSAGEVGESGAPRSVCRTHGSADARARSDAAEITGRAAGLLKQVGAVADRGSSRSVISIERPTDPHHAGDPSARRTTSQTPRPTTMVSTPYSDSSGRCQSAWATIQPANSAKSRGVSGYPHVRYGRAA